MIHYGLRRGHILFYRGNKAKTKEIIIIIWLACEITKFIIHCPNKTTI